MDFEQITGGYVAVDGTKIYYDRLGEGPPLVCIHTAGSCSMQYHEIMPLLARAGFRVIALDLPGHGKSLPVNWQPFRRMRDYGEFVWRFIEKVCGDEKPVVLGCSIGGNMATDLAAYHSDGLKAAIAMAGGAKVPGFPIAEREEPHASPGWSYFMEVGCVASSHHPMRPGKDVELQWLHRFAPQQVAIADLQCWADHDVVDKMADVSCPYLNVRGEADFFVDDAMVTNTLKNIPQGLGEAVFLEGIGHYPHFEQPERIAALALDFLKRRGIC
ncbi:alpha/beta hydrolase [uncultured Phenylobacterium sp.]|uniref:alpha/beta fold hydrolase n=1 Tax=uncultured Phenylobacterium sp. TaxID=349273 RepID=UPI0025F9CFB6|nr:alpha/beta hydrolase [uncultured Phenylobacterium sp.]